MPKRRVRVACNKSINDGSFEAGIEDNESGDTINICSGGDKDCQETCLKAAKKLRRLAQRMEVLALSSNPTSNTEQLLANGAKE